MARFRGRSCGKGPANRLVASVQIAAEPRCNGAQVLGVLLHHFAGLLGSRGLLRFFLGGFFSTYKLTPGHPVTMGCRPSDSTFGNRKCYFFQRSQERADYLLPGPALRPRKKTPAPQRIMGWGQVTFRPDHEWLPGELGNHLSFLAAHSSASVAERARVEKAATQPALLATSSLAGRA